MKKGLYVLAAMACLLLSACSKEGIDSVAGQGGGATREVKMSLGAGIQLFGRDEISEDEAGGFKALEEQRLLFEIRDGNNKFILNDDGKPPLLDGNNEKVPSKRGHIETEDLKGKAANIKFFVQVRKKNTTTIVGSLYQKWDYQSRNTTDWRLNGVNIPLTGVTPGTDELQVRVVAGGNLDAEKGEIVIPKPEYQELDLSKSNKISLPVPFVSDWIDLNYDGAQYTTVGDAKIKLKPLGVLLITTVRSSMRENVSLTGVRYVSNALAFQGTFTLDGSNNVPFKASGAHKFQTEVTEDDFYEIIYNFKEKMTPARTPNNSKVIVSWALPTGKPKAVNWATQNNQRGDVTNMISQPQTHVYAEGVTTTGSGKIPTNFNIVPIMGTNHNFGHGKSSAVNCELYDTPRQLLGYFAKYTVNAEGTGFDTSHDPNQVSLVNWKVAKDFLKGKELTGPDGQKAIFKMGSEAVAIYTANYFSSVWSANNAGMFFRLLDQTDPSKGALVARSRQIIYNKGTDEKPDINEAMFYLMQVYIPRRNPNASYMIIGRDFSKNRSFSKDQVVIRIEATMPNGAGNYPVGTTTLTSVALGKYYIGTAYSPIYDNKCAYDEDLWSDPVFLQGRVQRKMPAAGNYAHSSWNAGKPTEIGDVDNLYPVNKTRDDVGLKPVYWFWCNWVDYAGTGRLMKKLKSGLNPTWTGADWMNDMKDSDKDPSDPTGKKDLPLSQKGTFLSGGSNILFYPDNSGGQLPSVVRDAKYMWQALWPIANKYQGDDAD